MVLAGVIWMLIRLGKSNPDKRLGDLINFVFLRDKVTFNVLGMIFVNVAEAFMAASISPPGEIPINPLARFMGHLVVAIVGISLALSGMAALAKVKLAKDNRFNLWIKAITTVVLALMVPYLNAMLIAAGLKEINNFAHFVHGDITGAMMHSSYAMNATMIMTLMHYIFFGVDAVGILSSGDQGGLGRDILKSFGAKAKGEGSDIDKTITDRGEKERKSDIRSLVTTILTAYRIQGNADRTNLIARSIEAVDKMSDRDRASLTSKLVDLDTKIANWSRDKKGKTEDERSILNAKIYNAIYDIWKNSTNGGHGFGFKLPEKQSMKSGN